MQYLKKILNVSLLLLLSISLSTAYSQESSSINLKPTHSQMIGKSSASNNVVLNYKRSERKRNQVRKKKEYDRQRVINIVIGITMGVFMVGLGVYAVSSK